jgi:hypothetical protein
MVCGLGFFEAVRRCAFFEEFGPVFLKTPLGVATRSAGWAFSKRCAFANSLKNSVRCF